MSKKSERPSKQPPAAPRRARAYPILFALIVLAVVGSVLFTRRSKAPSGRAPDPQPTLSNATTTLQPSTEMAAAEPTNDWRAKILALPKETQAEAFSATGDELLGAGDFAQAAKAYRLSIERDASSESLHYNLGIALARSGETEEAIAAYNEALKIAPDYAEAHNNLGNLLMQKKRFPEAIEHFTAATRINPEVATGHNNLGIALANSGRKAEASAAFFTAVNLDGNYTEARFNLAQSYLARGDTNGALKELETVLQANPDFAPARKVLARILPANNPGR